MTVNPLRDPRDRRIPRVAGPCVLVMFGVTGDLARKKLMPAIYDLANRGLLPPGFSLVGFARRDWEDEDFAQVTYQAVKEHARTPFRETVWNQLSEGVRFVPGEFSDDDAFDRLAQTVRTLDAERGTGGNYAFYLSVPPKFFQVVVEKLKRSGLSSAGEPPPGRPRPWRRVVIEKPFGHDLPSAQELNNLLNDVFGQHSVFRIDHYLGKETVQNILALRFANTLYEPIWNRGYVDHIQITMAEDIGIGGRAGGNANLLSLSCRFSKPLLPGDTIICTGTVISVDDSGVASLEVGATSDRGDRVLTNGRATVRLSR